MKETQSYEAAERFDAVADELREKAEERFSMLQVCFGVRAVSRVAPTFLLALERASMYPDL